MTTYTVELPVFDLDVTNDDRAALAVVLAAVFAAHVGNDCLGQALRDLVANLGHCADRLPADEIEPGCEEWSGEQYLRSGLGTYREEYTSPE